MPSAAAAPRGRAPVGVWALSASSGSLPACTPQYLEPGWRWFAQRALRTVVPLQRSWSSISGCSASQVRVEAGGNGAARQPGVRALLRQPARAGSFEADAGTMNKLNVRMELNAGYTVERIPAALRIT